MTVAFVLNATAQMSDSQIIEFIQKEQKAGTSQAQIVTKLMQKGVDINQIRRIRQKYERQMKNGGLGVVADESMTKAETTLRTNNGDTKKEVSNSKLSKRKQPKNPSKTSNLRVSGNSPDAPVLMW